jgi:Xaa-Pro aminopeptidase
MRTLAGEGVGAGVRRDASEWAASAMLVTNAHDVGYLSGFTGEDSFLLVGRRWAVLLTDGRYAEQAESECHGVELHVRTGPMTDAVAQVVKAHRVRRIAVESEDLTLLWCERLGAKLRGRRIVPVASAVRRLRLVKDEWEIRAIRRAIRVAERAFRELIAQGGKRLLGRAERDVAAELDYLMRLGGASAPSFETIVAAGANSSLPHYRPGRRRIRAGEPVLIDWGARLDGYCSDLTRVVSIGRIPPKLSAVYEVVRRAQSAGIRAVKSGVSCRTADAAARELVAKAGYAERFVHGLGHGIGREVHESPGLARPVKQRLRAGMVVTVEPGIYLPGVGGVRIEDDVLVTRRGPRKLSSLPRTLGAMTL